LSATQKSRITPGADKAYDVTDFDVTDFDVTDFVGKLGKKKVTTHIAV